MKAKKKAIIVCSIVGLLIISTSTVLAVSNFQFSEIMEFLSRNDKTSTNSEVAALVNDENVYKSSIEF